MTGKACEECGSTSPDGRLWHELESAEAGSAGVWYCEVCWQAWEAWEASESNSGSQSANCTVVAAPPELVDALWFASQTTTTVSLGAWCGVKMAMRGLGVANETLPFDWIRISMDGLLQTLRQDFAGFLDFTYAFDGEHSRHYVKQDSHSFFHDNLDEEPDCEKYNRRIARFRELREHAEARVQRSLGQLRRAASVAGTSVSAAPALLFVRSLGTTLELRSVEALFAHLVECFGPKGVFLLLLLDHQPSDQLFFFANRPGLLLRTISKNRGHREEYDVQNPPYVTAYHEPIAAGLWHVNTGKRPEPHVELPDVNALMRRDGRGFIQHVCLGEDLTTSMSYDPQMPSCEALERAAVLEEGDSERELVEEMVHAHIVRCCEIGTAPHLLSDYSAEVQWLLARAMGVNVLASACYPQEPEPEEEWWEEVS